MTYMQTMPPSINHLSSKLILICLSQAKPCVGKKEDTSQEEAHAEGKEVQGPTLLKYR